MRRRPCNGTNIIVRHFAEEVKPKNIQNKDKLIGRWLLGCSGLVFAAVALGGSYYYLTYYGVRSVLNKALDPTSKKY